MTKTLIILSVDPELCDLIPPLDAEEKRLLRESIIEEGGCRDPIIYWETKGNPIIDGHNRHEICNGEGLPYPTKGMTFHDRRAARIWIRNNQLGKRNLTDTQRSILRGQQYNDLKSTQGGDHKSKGQNVPLIHAAKEVAESQGVSERTVKRDGRLAESLGSLKNKSPALAKAVESGAIPAKSAAALAETPKRDLRNLEKLAEKDLKEAIRAVVNVSKPSHENATGDRSVASTKAQVKIWYDAIARWLGQSPSIDEYRKQFPSQHGDRVLIAAKELYEAMNAWHGAIK